MPSKSVIYYAEHPAAAQRHREYQKEYLRKKYWEDETYRHNKRVRALERYHRLKALKNAVPLEVAEPSKQ